MIGRSEQTISNSFNCFFDVYFLQNSNSQEPKMSKVGEVQFLKAVKMQNKLGRRANSCEKCETIAIKLMFYGGKRLSFRIVQIDLEKPF